MNDDFRVLFDLWEDPPQEVAGRASATVPSELREKVAKFAAGKCTEEERDHMKKLLLEKPDLVPLLATEARALRPSDQ